MFYVNVCYNHTYGWSIDLERSSLKQRPNDRTDHELTLDQTSCFISLRVRITVCRSIRILELEDHTLRYDMAHLAGYSKNPLTINSFWEKASVEPPLGWSKGAAIIEMAIIVKDGIEVRNLLRARPALVEPPEPVYEVEITGETEAQRKNREIRNQEKRVGWENHVIKAREKIILCNSFRWDEADAEVLSNIFMFRSGRTKTNTTITHK